MTARSTRILVIRFSSIGDIVLTAPAVASLRQAIHGPCEIHFLTKANMAPVVEGFGALVDHVHSIEESTAEVQENLRTIGFDYVIDLHNNVRSRSIKRALDVIAFTVDKQNLSKWLLVRGWRKNPIPHIVERYIDSFAGAFGAVVPHAWPELFGQAAAPNDLPETYQVLAVGATHGGKQLTASLMQAIAEQCPVSLVLIGGPTDVERAEALTLPNVVSYVGRTSIAESAAILRGAQRVNAGDTGMMHLAAAMGVPVTSFWGCTRPNLGMAPWKAAKGSQIVSPEPALGSRPCSKLGNRCRHTPTCMVHTEQGYASGK